MAFREIWKKYRPGNYLRELSVVILGIFITLTATNYFSGQSRKKEYRQLIEMVQDELRANKRAIDNSISTMEIQLDKISFLYRHRDNLAVIPADTLEKYQYVFYWLEVPKFTDHTLEVLKYSSAIHYNKDIRIIRDIMEAYDNVGMCETYIGMFYDSKQEYIDRIVLETDRMATAIVGKLQAEYSSRAVVDFLNTTYPSDLIEECRVCSAKIGEIIGRLEKKYPPKKLRRR
ncbi:MAG: hypothetical protein LIO77_02160 [Rikenellaceae bacterium]|nr:hypothetical protein [Rikenellaceae bacterium]